MSLSAGAKLGPYEILSPLGAGGMGEVYRARDARLGREAALKVLPGAFACDAEPMARFQREAQVLASLNHPNIAAIYGLEESGGVRALVMELVEGSTLAERLSAAPVASTGHSRASGNPPVSSAGTKAVSKSPLPLDESLHFARQIAEALEYAHEPGVVHRDLKPANVKINPDGMVKVLDFGLAKLADDAVTSDPSSSSTLTAQATKAGTTRDRQSPWTYNGLCVDLPAALPGGLSTRKQSGQPVDLQTLRLVDRPAQNRVIVGNLWL